MSTRTYSKKTAVLHALWGLCLVAVCYLALCRAIGLDLLAHSPYDSYSLQAMLWRSGEFSMTENRPWLELAVFNDRYYISFPPFPTLVMLPLTFIFGENTPSQLVSFACVLLSYLLGYRLARRRNTPPWLSACMGVFLVLGCNMAEFALYGGVWNLAQSLGFLLTLGAFAAMENPRSGAPFWGLILIACAVGCRPFQAVYVPLLMYLAWRRLGFRRLIPALIVPALIALAYAAYNFVRFADPFQFGHDYLPEFAQQSAHGQFSLHYIPGNLANILRMPWWENGRLTFPIAFGFAFWLCNPLYVLFAGRFVPCAIQKPADWSRWILLLSLLVHFFLLLMHKSFGGVQFGTRYLCDLIPAMFWFWARPFKSRPAAAISLSVMLWGLAFNLYGAWYFHVMVG